MEQNGFPTPKRKKDEKRDLLRRNVNARAERIACYSCGSPLEIRNADMAEMATCRACGSILDLESDKNAILGKIRKGKKRPGLQLGTKGDILGATVEVIGLVQLKSGIDTWSEYLLFSPKRGYTWLQEESGHWVMLNKMKYKPGDHAHKTSENGYINQQGQKYKVISKGKAAITYIDGEFPYQARVGDKINYIDAVSPPLMISAEWTQKEIEWYTGRYITRERLCEFFKIKTSSLPRQHGVGSCQPFPVSSIRRTFFWSLLVGAVAFIAFIIAAAYQGKRIARFNVQANQYLLNKNPNGFLSKPFKINKPGIIQITSAANVNNSWIYAEIQLLDEEQNTLLSYTNEISYYHGTSGGESWSEGSRSDSSVFLIEKAGTYYLAVAAEGGQGSSPNSHPRNESMSLTVYEDVILQRYFIVGAILFLVFPAYELFRRNTFEQER